MTTGSFPDRLHLILLPAPRRRRPFWRRLRKRRRKFEVIRPFRYLLPDFEDDAIPIEVPTGTIIDGASIPCFCWRLIGQPMGEYAEASVVHDYLWGVALDRLRRGMPADFSWANAVFLDAMQTLGVSRWRRFAMWLAVSLKGVWVEWRT